MKIENPYWDLIKAIDIILRKIEFADGKAVVNMFEMTKLVSKHLS